MLPVGANSFLLDGPIFRRGFGMQEDEQEVTKVISLVSSGRKSTKCV